MRLQHFCIGSIRTQDLLISKSFLPTGASQENGGGVTDIQAVWAKFLDLFQNELRWTTSAAQHPRDQQGLRSPSTARSPPPPSSSPHSSTEGTKGRGTTGTGGNGGGGRSGSGMAGIRADSPHLGHSPSSSPSPTPSSGTNAITGDLQPVAIPLFSTDCCFIYQTIHDLVLVACCPLPPTPSIASATVTRIPFSLPGRRQPTLSRGGSVPGSPGGSSLLDSQEIQRQRPIPELAFSTAAGLHTSYHGTIEFLGQLITALERYLVPSQQGALGTAGSRGKPGLTAAATTKSKAGSGSNMTLSAELVRLNTGIVYEILEECMGLGYPLMPSLTQLDLLIFGAPKAVS
ncbi:hypothetical protein K457DRAFT_18774 [Linnemannia elongata AG-77]|uniref:Uncharacterized protein n=1 Tax=Linnemannia elongata AG-77 TaxID=1314771 RepID=A0A197JZQ5_9FUNG|nr:hypothetical protein K457DRAFT_18774 [Linnemannia elongata AG-77]